MSETKYLLPLKSDRLLDVLRGIAVLMVITIHLAFTFYSFNKNTDSGEYLKNITTIARFGSAGPMLFFLISGFLLESLYRQKYASKTFFKRRIARIYPMWILFTIISIISAYTTGFYGTGIKLDSLHNIAVIVMFILFLGLLIPSTWDFIPGGWSIEGEVINYLTFPIIRKTNIVWVLLLQTLFAIFVLFAQNYIFDNPNGYLRSFQTVSTATFWFIIGVLISRVATKKIKLNFKINSMLFIFIATNLMLNAPNGISQVKTSLAIILAVGLGVFIEKKIETIAKLISEIGKYSYGIYLIHFIFLTIIAKYSFIIFNKINESNMVIVLSILCVSFLFITLLSYYFAKILYKYFELPFINLGKK